jgi:hypothetical protein
MQGRKVSQVTTSPVPEHPQFHKNQPIWWDISMSQTRPQWIPKGRDIQAGWFQGSDGNTAAITIINESREMETYMIPLNQLRVRLIT